MGLDKDTSHLEVSLYYGPSLSLPHIPTGHTRLISRRSRDITPTNKSHPPDYYVQSNIHDTTNRKNWASGRIGI